jgi:hypothetical protein
VSRRAKLLNLIVLTIASWVIVLGAANAVLDAVSNLSLVAK